ncbi:MAG: ribonuclease III [Clostridiales bacterium]
MHSVNIKEFENRICYRFKDKKHLIIALSHSSYVNEKRLDKLECNERTEFLGDSILNSIISENLFKNHTDFSEGDMTRVRANVVCENSLLLCANKINLGKYLLLGKGEEITGGRSRVSILADGFEAVIGAIYLDGGYENARNFVLKIMEDIISKYIIGNVKLDYKTELQEIVQKKCDDKVLYEVINEMGPDHDKVFISQVKVKNKVVGVGEGKTKKEAEQNAAKIAINNL